MIPVTEFTEIIVEPLDCFEKQLVKTENQLETPQQPNISLQNLNVYQRSTFVARYPKLLNPVSKFTEIRAEPKDCFEKQIIQAENQFKIPQQE